MILDKGIKDRLNGMNDNKKVMTHGILFLFFTVMILALDTVSNSYEKLKIFLKNILSGQQCHIQLEC